MGGNQVIRVLVVDGDASARSAVFSAVGAAGECVGCSRGGEAHNRLRGERFDVIVCDSDLSDIDGLSFLDLVRGVANRPMVVMTCSAATVEWTRHAFKRGAADVLSKPVEAAEIGRILELVPREGRQPGTSHVGVNGALGDAGDLSRGVDAGGDADACDTLTGVLTRAAFVRRMETVRTASRRENRRACIVVFDIDGFAGINERESRAVGDRILRGFAERLRRVSVACEAVGRTGGNRFATLMRDVDETIAAAVIRRFQRSRTDRDLHIPDHSMAAITYRVGIAASQIGHVESAGDMLERAESAATRAKELGGNQIVCWGELSSAGPSLRLLAGASYEQVSGWIRRTRQQLKSGYVESTMALVAAVEAKEPLTREHARVVSHYSEAIAVRMGLPSAQVESLKTAALLHDIGKIGVPDAILQKPGPLTREEFEIVKRHPQTAVDILGHASFLHRELPCILHHHERFDGGGYPAGLAGADIPLGARILCIADALDAMLSNRSYKRGYPMERVREELIRCAGKQFDAEAAEAALGWLDSDGSKPVVATSSPRPGGREAVRLRVPEFSAIERQPGGVDAADFYNPPNHERGSQ